MPSILTIVGSFQQILLLELSDSFDVMKFLLWILFALVIYAIVKAYSRTIRVVDSHWHHMFETIPFTPLEFYELLKKGIDGKEIQGLSYSSITHSESGLLSSNRIYLRITFREHIMDICAAPFAKEAFFVSWWLGNAGDFFRNVLIGIPMIGVLFNKREKTFYERDTEIMFKETIARCVKDAIEQLTETKGLRQLDLNDWRGSEMQFKNKR